MLESNKKLEVDYLVVGAGATSMAFVDEIISITNDVSIIVVEKRGKAGGHWNDTYPFATLQHPAAWYGVNSRILGSGGQDMVSKAKITAYYEDVANDLSATGRVKFYWQCEYRNDGKIVSLVDNAQQCQVIVRRKIVDGTHCEESIPSIRMPAFAIEEGVNLVPINGLVHLKFPWEKYVIIGSGKTGHDAVLHLIDLNVDPEKITWIISNDCWYLNRDVHNMADLWDGMKRQYQTILKAKDINDVYRKYEKDGIVFRIDEKVWPTKMRVGTITYEDLDKIRRVKNVIRQGRIKSIGIDAIKFENGVTIPIDCKNDLFVDCTSGCNKEKSHALKRISLPIFDGNVIHLQPMLLGGRNCISSALVAALEIRFPDCEEKKNDLCTPQIKLEHPSDWFRNQYITQINSENIYAVLDKDWNLTHRLSKLSHMKNDQVQKLRDFKKIHKDDLYKKLQEFAEQRKIYDKYPLSISRQISQGG